MTWQLTLASCAAANLKPTIPTPPDPSADVAVEWDASLVGANCILSNSNRDVTNTGVNNSSGLVTANKPIKPSNGVVYWEVVLVALGAATNFHEIGMGHEGWYSVTSASSISNRDNNGVIIRDGSSTASILVVGGSVLTGLTNIRTAGQVLQFALDAAAGKVWIGLNGTWFTGAFGTPNVATGVPTLLVEPGLIWWPMAKPTDNGDQFRLQSIAANLTYSVPTGARALGSDLVNFLVDEFPFKHTAFSLGAGSIAGWSVEAGGGTPSAGVSSTGVYDAGALITNKGYRFQDSLVYYPRININGQTFGGLYQEGVFDSRWNTLIDTGQVRFRMSASWSFGALASPPSTLPTMRVEFYDSVNSLIGTQQVSPAIVLAAGTWKDVEYVLDVPANTRKVRYIYRMTKNSSGTSVHYSFTRPKARLERKLNLLRVDAGGNVNLVLGKREGVIGLAGSVLNAILVPPKMKLLCHFDGADAATTTVDSSSYNLASPTFTGNAQLDTAQKKFGTASLLLDGTGDRISYPDSEEFNLHGDAFTIDLQVRFNAGVTNQAFITQWGSGGNGWAFYMDAGSLKFRATADNAIRDIAFAWVPSTGVWYHVAVDRDVDGIIRLYIDGVMVAKVTTYKWFILDSAAPLVIGAIGNTNAFPGWDFNGWIDEIRILKGQAAWDTDAGFTAPTAPY